MDFLGPLLLSLLALAIQIGVIVGIVLLVVRATGHHGGDRDVAGAIRRFFVYGFLLVAAVLLVEGVRQLLVALVGKPPFAGRGTQVAGAVSLVVIGGVVWGFLWRYVRRRLIEDPVERERVGWMLYLNAVLAISLGVALGGAVMALRQLMRIDDFDVEAWAALVAYGAGWIYHQLLWRDAAIRPRLLPRLPGLVGSLFGLTVAAIGLGMVLTRVFEGVYDLLTGARPLVETGDLGLSGLAVGVIGGAVWWYHWVARETRRARGEIIWLAYVIVFPVLVSVVTIVSVGSAVLFQVLVWFFGSHAATTPAEHFAGIPWQLAVVVSALAVWTYHRRILRAGRTAERTEPDRVYDYVLAAAGLGALGTGITIALLALFDALSPAFAGTTAGNVLLGAITAILVGGPVWWRHWARAESFAREAPELRSVTRRIYVFVVLGAAAAVVFVGAIIVLQGLLVLVFSTGGSFESFRMPLASLITGIAIGAYHLQVWRTDRRRAETTVAPVAAKEVVLVAAVDDAFAATIGSAAHARVRLMSAAAEPPSDADRIVDAIDAAEATKLLVVATGDDVEVVPLR